ncbi:hypothetical protein RN053_00105, partial [Pantoea dispersa]|nr:hypothetical protein [Pantoea dispersa]
EARDAFAGIYHKSFRPAGVPVLITSRLSETLHVPTCDGVVIIDRSVRPKPGDAILFEAYGICHLGRLGPNYIIWEDGDMYEGGRWKISA